MKSLTQLTAQLQTAQTTLAYKQGVKDQLLKNVEEYNIRITEIIALNELYTKTSTLLQYVSVESRQQVATIFEQIVTDALQTILKNKTLQFKVYFIQKKTGTDVSFKLFDTVVQKELSIIHSFGGGVKDIVSTILRIMVLELHKPTIQGPIILDEVGKNISKEYQENFGTFLQALSKQLDRQIILITHSPIIAQAASKVLTVSKDVTGCSLVTEGADI